ncbi:hypothetical protein ACLUS2_016685 [Curtobacterium flaccumfaciens pv. flaccumfaciens]|uniref:hypothetical protein n=1 Tax=Curtobacterium flaccumfaciens TaxID=2035 RepID=UPI0039940122
MTAAAQTDTERAAAGRRWAEADERAHLLLAQTRTPSPPVLGFVVAVGLVLVALCIAAVAVRAGSDARFAVAGVVTALGFVIGLGDAVRVRIRRRRNGAEARRAPVLAPVLAPLQQREQRAVTEAATGRRAAPEDRRIVVQARAVELGGGGELASLAGFVIVCSAITFAGGAFWPFAVAGGIATAGQFAWTARSAVLARRYLDAHPVHLRNRDARSGHGETPSGSIESRT